MNVNVPTLAVTVVTVKLTKALLKQIPIVDYPRPRAEGSDYPKPLGWFHGSVLGSEHASDTWILFELSENVYGRYHGMTSSRSRYQQLYIV